MRLNLFPAAMLCLGLAMACGGGGGGSNSGSVTGKLTLRFGSDSFPGIKNAYLSLEKVEGSADGSTWLPLGDVKATYDLLTLQNGRSVVILPAVAVPPVTYNQFRITWATVNYAGAGHQPAYLVDANNVERLISPQPTTTVVNASVTVPPNGSATAQIMLTGQQVLQARPGNTYTFQGVGRAFDLAASATITGLATANGSPLPQVEVFAEYLDGSLNAVIQRRAFTDLSGTFTLEGLPAGTPYFVVSQPVIYAASGLPTATFPAMAVTPTAGLTTNTFTANLPFPGSLTPGSFLLTVTPVSTAAQGTWGELIQTFLLDQTTNLTRNFIIRSETAVSLTTTDQVTFLGVPPGFYGVAAERSTSGAAPVKKAPANSLQVTAGTTATTQSLSYP